MADGLKLRIEEFKKASHNRDAFSCGFPPIDNFFRKSLSEDLRAMLTACYVSVDVESGEVVGFFAFNAHSIPISEFPKDKLLKKLKHIPAIYLKALAVDKQSQGQKIGQWLIVQALKTIANVAKSSGAYVIILDALDQSDDLEFDPERRDRMVKFYERAGFQLFPEEEKRMFVRTKDVIKTLGLQ